jgi:hypothetical protein
MAFGEVQFEGRFYEYIATSGSRPRGHTLVSREMAIDALRDALNAAYIDWSLLELLGIEQHPSNLHSTELEVEIRRSIEGGWISVYRRDWFQPIGSSARGKAPIPPANIPEAVAAEAYLAVEVFEVGGAALAAIGLEIIAPDASVHNLRTEADGKALLERLVPGTCRVRLPYHDASAWRVLDGTAQLAERRAARRHVVMMGECLSTIAHDYGHTDWRLVWEFSDNAALRERRPSPHVLRPGDVVMVPGLQIAELACSTNSSHRIEVEPQLLELKVTLADHLGRPFKAQPYQLWCEQCEGEPHERGTTDGAGLVEKNVPRGTRSVLVLLEKQGLMFSFQLSAVPQLPDSCEALTRHEVAAVQARLNALGVGAGPVTGTWTATTERALQTLRRARGASGPLDSADLDALRAFGV